MKNNLSTVMGFKRLKVSDIHRATGISRSTLTSLYYGTGHASLETLSKLCDYLQIPLSELIEYTPKEPTKEA